MKTKVYLRLIIFTIFIIVSNFAADAVLHMQIFTQDNSPVNIVITDNLKMTVEGSYLTFTDTGSQSQFSINDVKKITYADLSSVGIVNTETDEIKVLLDGQTLSISGGLEGETCRITDISGNTVIELPATEATDISLAGSPRGIYILTVGNRMNLKFIL